MSRKKLLQKAFIKIEELQKRLEQQNRNLGNEPIAVIGMGLRFPGAAHSPESFWDLLKKQENAVVEIPSNRWDVNSFYDPDPEKAGKMYARHGAFLDQIDQFDAAFFGITPLEAHKMDPQQRILLEVVWESLERSGRASERLSGSNTGVFIGLNGDDYMNLMNRNSGYEDIDLYYGTGVNRSIAAGRISYTFGLKGPCVSLDTACSGSLVAVHLACQSLRMRECDMAVAGGITLMIVPDGFIGGSKGKMLSPEGRCKTFDASADGYVRGEGCGIVTLKRLSEALTDDDSILAVIRGSAINQDGRSGGMTAPSGKAQEDVMHKALANADLTPGDIGYVETHGTGTVLGDPIEVQALGSVYGSSRSMESPLLIGAVKTNLGHLEAAAGVAGLMKTILILKHGEIPPNLHFKTPNPHIPWSELPIEVVNKLTPWPAENHRRIAAVSAFGFSGTNSHIIVESAPLLERKQAKRERNIHLLTLSAKTPEALKQMADRYCREIDKKPSLSIADMCFTANSGRVPYGYRLAVIGETAEAIKEELSNFQNDRDRHAILKGQKEERHQPKAGFLFTGQGAQTTNMGSALFETQPVFRQTLERCNDLARPYLGMHLLPILYPDSEDGANNAQLIHQTRYSQPILFAFEYALAQMWRSWGVEPAFVMGHSVGEYVAACIAGVFSLEDGIKLVIERGRLMQALPGDGAMAAVFADSESVEAAIAQGKGRLSIAAYNSPENTVISGTVEDVERIRQQMAEAGIGSKRLVVSHAFHSELVASMVPDFRKIADEIEFKKPRIELISNISGRLADADQISHGDYWCRHILQPVMFRESVRTLVEQGCRIFLEVGPHPTLISMARQCLEDDDALCIPSLRRGRDDWEQLLKASGHLFVHGVNMDWNQVDLGFGRRRIPLPTYPFERERYWAKLPKKRHDATAFTPETHPMLERRLLSPKLKEQIWEKRIDTAYDTYLKDHRVLGKTLVPATFYLEMAHAAAGEIYGGQSYRIDAFNIYEPLVVNAGEQPKLQIIVADANGDEGRFEIFSLSGGPDKGRIAWKLHASGGLRREEEANSISNRETTVHDPKDFETQGCQALDGDRFYQGLKSSGVNYGPSFQGLKKIWRIDEAALARIVAPDGIFEDCNRYHVHPAILDTCFQLLGMTLLKDGDLSQGGDIYLPMGLESYRVHQRGWNAAWAHVVLRSGFSEGTEIIAGDIQISDDGGRLLAEISGLRFKRATADALEHAKTEDISGWFYKTCWRDIEATNSLDKDPRPLDHWLILADRDGLGEGLAEGLRQKGDKVQVVFPGKAYEVCPDGSIRVDPLSVGDFKRLVQRLTTNGSQQIDGIIHLWNLELAGEDIDIRKIDAAYEIGCLSLVHLIQALSQAEHPRQPKLTLVTTGAVSTGEPDRMVHALQTPVWGLGRVLAAEYPQLESVLVDIDPAVPREDYLQPLLEEVAAIDRSENQIALRQGRRLGLRLIRNRGRQQEEFSVERGTPYQLEILNRGVIENLRLKPTTIVSPGDGEVQIQIEATGQNFRDVLNVLDMYPGDPGALGNECVGRISALGKGVKGFSKGDPVLALTPQAFCSHVNTRAEMVVKRPTSLSVEAAATIPITFLTAEYALNHLGGMQAGDRVLIHAAAGGVGMAALQLAQRGGAEIFATAGSPKKRKFLRSLGVRHVMNSRNLDFAEQIMMATEGQGIDIVLNSLAGEFITKSIALLRRGGRFLELGKTDLRDVEKVNKINPQASYQVVFLGDICQKDPASVQVWFRELLDAFDQGDLKPLPVRLFPIGEVEKAFRFMAQAKHIGKIVVDQRQVNREVSIRADATYLITGGLGGLGLQFARWIVERGALHLVLLARSPAGEKVQKTIDQLKADGAKIIIAQVDVAEKADLQNVLSSIEPGFPLRGIIHAAGVVDDAALINQNRERFIKVFRPKVIGSWLLHSLTEDIDLDFFVMCSAGAALFGSPGQANYAAANAFMDGLAYVRRGEGLPATSINWGPWDKVGMAADLGRSNRQKWQNMGMGFIQPWQGCLALERLLGVECPQVAVLPMDWKQMVRNLKGRQFPSLIADIVNEEQAYRDSASSSVQPSDLRSKLEALDAEDRYDMLLKHVRQQVFEALELKPTMEVKLDLGLTDIGMDSLMAVEISNRLKRSLDCNLPSTLAFEYPTIDAIVNYLTGKLTGIKFGGAAIEIPAVQKATRTAAAEELTGLSEEDVEKSLLKELEDTGY